MNGPDSSATPPQPLTPAPQEGKHRGRWMRWLRRGALALLALMIVGVVFYQPIGIWALEKAAVTIARKGNLDLSLKISGNLISNLTIESLEGQAIGETPVRKLSVERADFRYSFPRMLRNGVTDFLSSYHLKNATVEVDEVPSDAPEDAQAYSKRLTSMLRDILQQPALFSNRVELENVNVRLNLHAGLLAVDSIHILLDPVQPGFIQVGRVSIPGLPQWHQLSAEATYNGRRLVLDDLELGDEMEVVHAELIPANATNDEHVLLLKLNFFGGEIDLDLRSQDVSAALKLNIKNISIDRLGSYFQLEPVIGGTLDEFTAELTGEPETPSTWEGRFGIGFQALKVDQLQLGALTLRATLAEGIFRLRDSGIVSGHNVLKLEGEQPFPGSFRELLTKGLELTYQLESPNLKEWHPALPKGRVQAHGKLLAGKEKFAISTTAKLSDLRLVKPGEGTAGDEGSKADAAPLFSLAEGEITLHAAFAPEKREPDSPWFTGLKFDANFRTAPETEGTGMILQSIALDQIALAIRQEEGQLTLESLDLQRGENRVAAKATVKLPTALEPLKAWEELEFNANFTVQVPSLEAFNAPDQAQALRGKLEGSGAFERAGGITHGEGTLEATGLRWREFEARRLSLHLPLEDTHLPRAHLRLELNDTDYLEATARLQLTAPYDYEAAVEGKLGDLSLFQPLVGKPLGGSLDLQWKGTGRLDAPLGALDHRGEGALRLVKGTFDTLTPLDAEIAARYTPEEIVISRLQASAPQGKIATQLRWAEQRLTIPDLTLDLGPYGAVTGQLALPLDLSTPKDLASLLPADGALEGALTLKQVNLAPLFPPPPPKETAKRGTKAAKAKKAAPLPPTVQGVVDATLALGGTVAAPQVVLDVKARELKSGAVQKLGAAAIDLKIALKEQKLSLKGEARAPSQTALKPLRVEGELPLNLHRIIQEGKLDPATPISARVLLPTSSAKIFADLSPSLRYVEGTLSLDASAKGTVGDPKLTGGLHFNLPAMRLADTNIPGINRFRGDLLFTGDRLTVQRFEGDVAGGPFSLSGDIGLKNLKAPEMNLRLKSTGTLLVRNDALTIRTDSNLRLTGPLQTATVKGKVTLRKSRFYRDIEILPLALPGKPVAEPVESTTEVSIDVPPLRDWKFDIAVRTKEPFLIRSNMARGGATVDLRVGGTGLAPTLDGTVRLENLVASLPFSRLEIEHGFIQFNPADSFNPTLDIHGSSRVRNTMIHAHIYGTASEPETIFTSEPPLPQEEIIALLATGATTQGLAGNNEVMAGRAGSLLLQNLYHKMMRQRPKKNNLAKAGDDPLGDRFSLDVGTVDPRTGRQEVGGRFRLNKEFEVGAGLDVEGDVRVQLRYLLRFR